MPGEQCDHGGLFGHASGGLADEVNDGIALLDVGVEFLQRAAARDEKIFLHGDIEVGAFEVMGQQIAVRRKLVAYRREKEFFISRH